MSGSTLLSFALTSPLSSRPPPPSTTTSCWLYSSPISPLVAMPASKRLHPKRLHLHPNPSSGVRSLNPIIPKAAAAADDASLDTDNNADASSGIDNTADSPTETTDKKVSVDKLPLETKLQMMAEQKLKMKLAKKIRLRRKRLVRKRRLRKKGRWPPSKMKKLKNV